MSHDCGNCKHWAEHAPGTAVNPLCQRARCSLCLEWTWRGDGCENWERREAKK